MRAGLAAGGVDVDLAGGADPAAGAADRRGRCAMLLANVRTPEIRRGRPRCAARGEPARRTSGSRELSAARLDLSTRRSTPSSRTPSAARARRSRGSRTAATRPRARSRRRLDDDVPIRVAVTVAGDADRDRLRRHRAGGRGERERAARRHARGVHLRRQGARSAPTSRSTPASYARSTIRAPDGSSSTRAPVGRRRRQHRRRASGSPTPCCSRSRRRSTFPRRARGR